MSKHSNVKQVARLKQVHMLLSTSLSLISEQAGRNREAITKTMSAVNQLVNDACQRLNRGPVSVAAGINAMPTLDKGGLNLWKDVIRDLDHTRRYKLNRYLNTGRLERTRLSLSEQYLYEAVDTLNSEEKGQVLELVSA